MKMRAVDILTNLKNWTSWDYKAYKMDETEADVCKKALENYIWHDIKTQGLPKTSGVYLFKLICDDVVDYVVKNYIPGHESQDTFNKATYSAWRPILDEEVDNGYSIR